VRLTAAEKAEVIRLVEGSDLSVRRTLTELGVHRSTFYAWYRRYAADGEAGLVAKTPAAQRYWNRIPPAVREQARRPSSKARTAPTTRGPQRCSSTRSATSSK
jgi:putative transposase